MAKNDAVYIVGEHWLDKRRDGRAPTIWQIARYVSGSRSIVYKSTRTDDLTVAKAAIHAHVEVERARRPQAPEDAEVVVHLFLYWREHGRDTRNPATIAGSLRAFIGFLLQDEAGVRIRFSQMNRALFKRFVKWRMAPHSYTVSWDGADLTNRSDGVRGESVQRNLDDVRAALNHAVAHERVPVAPKVPSVDRELRSPPRSLRLSLAQLGAMIGYASQPERPVEDVEPNKEFARWLWLMIGTACRPNAALAFDPRRQWLDGLIDLHPPSWPRTKKRNPIVPVAPRLRPVLDAWAAEEADREGALIRTKSRRTAWRTMRRVLDLPSTAVAKTIRHTIATELRRRGVPGEQLSVLLGHRPPELAPMTAVYAHYDPAYLREAVDRLDSILGEVERHAVAWSGIHVRMRTGRGAGRLERRTRPRT